MTFILNHTYIFLTVIFAVSSQLIVKWQMTSISFTTNETMLDKFTFAFSMLLNPYIIASVMLTLLSGLSWMIAMTKFDISYAYPFTALGFAFVLVLSSLFFHEDITVAKIIGVACIMFGVYMISKGI